MTFNPSCIWFEDVLWCRSDPLLVALAQVGNALFRQFPCISTPYVRSVPSRTICPECRLERSRWRGGHRLSAEEPAAAAEVRLGHKEGDSCDPLDRRCGTRRCGTDEITPICAVVSVHWGCFVCPASQNFRNDRKYDFKGGWGSQGTEIFMPLDPKHMVYTRIGQKRLMRGTVLESRMAEMFSKFVREHAFRHIFSPVEDPAIPRLRPRYINLEMYRNEKAEWAKWAEEQANAELDLSRPLPGG
jgi:hypothetical protein